MAAKAEIAVAKYDVTRMMVAVLWCTLNAGIDGLRCVVAKDRRI